MCQAPAPALSMHHLSSCMSPLQAVGSTIQGRYHAVLMDFGSARPAPVEIQNRTEALTLQEEAEVRHCRASAAVPEWPWASSGRRCSHTPGTCTGCLDMLMATPCCAGTLYSPLQGPRAI